MENIFEEKCLRCNKQAQIYKNMKLLISICGHNICESCRDSLFAKNQVMHCPKCNTKLHFNNFVTTIIKNSNFKEESKIRKRILSIYNKKLSHFNNDLRQYNDYLEEIEDIIYNLSYGDKKTIREIQQKVDFYQKQNERQICDTKIAHEIDNERLLEDLNKKEREYQEKLNRLYLEESKAKEIKLLHKKRKFAEIESGNTDIDTMINEHMVNMEIVNLIENMDENNSIKSDPLSLNFVAQRPITVISTAPKPIGAPQNKRNYNQKELSFAAYAAGYNDVLIQSKAIDVAFFSFKF
eukprot:TRINITY_DN1680_c0_g1_i1.p1 TRINITY_DN1680_c0_g1~~TRINITY_DN1680_c0_g1_i1.p1  ORF type:complete len:295 (-),score=45.93 TRINITY_DN1680_c0_g1_i1:62-946(-)